ncbi:uncharacterized protein LOC143063862 [Mytilus galloprovincialis]|uniref:uncharacterized protein LOC143063862 n=1 Tax=Mytilus galloprovincialis TaxID=29158 RepID=UPI003F7B7188
MALPKLFRKTQVRFSAKDDLNLLKEVLAENPYKDKTKWEVVAQNVKENVDKVFNVTSRRVRERTQLLLQQFQKENYEALKRSGTEEEYTEKQQLLQEIQSLAEEEDKEQKEKAQQKDKDEHSAKLIRKRAMEALTPVKISNDSEGVTVTPSKITKIKGNESIMSYLKEKCDVEKDIKMEEVSIRKEELKLERERFELEREERKQKIENDKQQQLLLMELIKTVKKS